MESGTHDVRPFRPARRSFRPAAFRRHQPELHYLTEILPPGIGLNDPACGAWLGCFLDQVPGTVHDLATLVIDRECRVERTLVIPNRYVLAGVGMDGQDGAFRPADLGARPALRADAHHRAGGDPPPSQIRDSRSAASPAAGRTGIDLSNSTHVDVQNIRLSGFGIAGRQSFANDHRRLEPLEQRLRHRPGLRHHHLADPRRTRSASAVWPAIAFDSTTRASVVAGGVMESNPVTAIFLRGINNTVQNNWFEGNGGASGGFAIQVSPPALDSRILNNLFSSNDILDPSADHLALLQQQRRFGVLLADNCP